MFHVGELGDCFWLNFKDGTNERNVLIDCGSFRNGQPSKDRLNTIVGYIKPKLKSGKFDVVVGTHQHNDHLSGFVHCEEQFKDTVSQVWLSWLDDPADGAARQIRKEEKKLVDNVHAIANRLGASHCADAYKIADMLGFYSAAGNAPAIPAKATEILKEIGDEKPEYLNPGDVKAIPGISKEVVKVYVLGPPRKKELLFDKDPDKTQTYDRHLALANASATRILSALENRTGTGFNRLEDQFPFNQHYKQTKESVDKSLHDLYNDPANAWRKIDEDWLQSAVRLGLYLDSYTNNSSLVLAFELVRSGKVLLFAADAQTGNWVSWQQVKWADAPGKTINDLLQNTVLYKVGHHGSHNATLKDALETMDHAELVAMIPVDENDGNITKKNGWKMPATNLYRRLKEKTNNRVLRMDKGYDADCDPKKNKTAWSKLEKPVLDKDNLFVEYTVKG